MNRHVSPFLLVLASSILAGSARGQSINFDIQGNTGTTEPHHTFSGAAGSAGIWNEVFAAIGNHDGFVDANSLPTPAVLNISTGQSGRCNPAFCAGALPTGSDNEALMDDYLRFNGELKVSFRNLNAGTYDVYVYAWAPDNVQYRTLVYSKALGGAWPMNNMQMADRTYTSKSSVPVSSNGKMSITLKTQISFGTLNGIQLVQTGTAVGTSFCHSMPNSSGEAAKMVAVGSLSALENLLTVACTDMPTNTFTMLITSQTSTMTPMVSGAGYLCVGGPIGRGVGGQIFNTGPLGFVSTPADLTAHPTPSGPTTVLPGSTGSSRRGSAIRSRAISRATLRTEWS